MQQMQWSYCESPIKARSKDFLAEWTDTDTSIQTYNTKKCSNQLCQSLLRRKYLKMTTNKIDVIIILRYCEPTMRTNILNTNTVQ